MTYNLLQSIRNLGQFSEEQIGEIVDACEKCTYKKGEFLLGRGEVCNAFWFLESGSVHQYHKNSNMDLVTTGLFVAGQWVLDHSSFTGRKATTDSFEAYQDLTAYALTIHELHALIARSQVYFQLGKILDHMSDRPNLKDQAPDDRYLQLFESHPDLLKTFPLKYIASYLEMAPETLSRVRKRISSIS